jgi:hypothetical protein
MALTSQPRLNDLELRDLVPEPLFVRSGDLQRRYH